MIFPDYHLHSLFSSDSEADIHKIITKAKEKGMSSICITDHYDMDFPVNPDEPDMDFNLDIDNYYSYMSRIKDEYAGAFELRIGVELGVTSENTDKLNTFCKNHPELDFIIASTHLVDGMDPYYPEFFKDKSDREGYYRYFETILEGIRGFNNYNVYGHMDYIVRYGKKQSESFDIRDYYDILKEILRIIVSNGKGIEINTGSLYKGMTYPHPHIDILRMYKEAGGEIITVGSDAHKPEYVGYGFEVARDILLSLGFKYYCTFQKQKPEFEKLV